MFNFTLDRRRIVAMLLGICAVVLFNTIQTLDIHPFHALWNLIPKEAGTKKLTPEEQIQKKLEGSPKNIFNLTQDNSLIPQAHASEELDTATSYIVIDENTKEIVLEKNSNTPLPIASLTKIMSAVITLDLVSPQDIFTVSKHASNQIPTKIGVVTGEKMTVDELLKALLLTSANDAAQVLSDNIDAKYKKGSFVLAMNEKAKLLGLANTHFSNPQGFDSKQNYSSSNDLAILAHYALTNYPEIRAIVQKDYAFLPKDHNHKQFDLYNWNGLLGVYPGVTGLKIGNTGRAGNTTIVSSTRSGQKLLAVVLGTNDVLERDMTAAHLLDIGFAKAYSLPEVQITEEQLLTKYSSWKYFN